MRLSGSGARPQAQSIVPDEKTSAPLGAVYLTACPQAHIPGAGDLA